MSTEPIKLTVVSAGVGQPSSTGMLADRLTQAVQRSLEAREREVETTRVEVRDHAHAVVDATFSHFPTGELAEAVAAVQAADALIWATPTFQASYAGLFKSFVDLIEESQLKGAPVLLAATGGTERHSLVIDHALRPLVAYLGGVSVPTGVYAATQDFGAGGDGHLDARVQRAADQLATMLAGSSVRQHVADPFDDVVPFEEMLRRGGH